MDMSHVEFASQIIDRRMHMNYLEIMDKIYKAIGIFIVWAIICIFLFGGKINFAVEEGVLVKLIKFIFK